MRKRLSIALLLIVCLVGAGYLIWWFQRVPLLTVRLDPAMAQALDRDAFLAAFQDAGVQRIRLLPSDDTAALGANGHDIAVSLVLSQERNPQLDAEMLALGLTGPGFTTGYIGHVYQPDIELFEKKHQAKYRAAGKLDSREIKRRLITNTAIHETWHAITQSTSHNAQDLTSVMYIDPGKAALQYGTQRMPFTRGHRDRLRTMFAARPFLGPR